MDAYQCNIIVNLSISLEMRRSIVVGWYSMLFKFDNNYAKQHKEPLMEAYHCIITRIFVNFSWNKNVLCRYFNILC